MLPVYIGFRPAWRSARFDVKNLISALSRINEHSCSDSDIRRVQYQIAIVPRYGSVHGAGNRRANEPVPQRCAALAIGVEGVNAIVLRRDENNVVRTAGYAHLRHEQRLPIDERIDTTGEHLSEQRGINVRRRQLSFV